MDQIFKIGDVNHDGVIVPSEMDSSSGNWGPLADLLFQNLDKNKDGHITLNEMKQSKEFLKSKR